MPPVYKTSSLVLIEAVTHLHVGVGRGGGTWTVDLAIQRDEYGFPTIYSSSLKGALKTALLSAYLDNFTTQTTTQPTSQPTDQTVARIAVNVLLGPDPEPEESFESAVALLDAVLVAIPARSLKGVYAYVTSPHLLHKFKSYATLARDLTNETKKTEGQTQSLKTVIDSITEIENLFEGKSCVCLGNNCGALKLSELKDKSEMRDKIVLLEDFWLDCDSGQSQPSSSQSQPSSSQSQPSSSQSQLPSILNLEKPLLVLNDDVAREVVNRALIKIARVRINRATKTVEEGGLWTEEYVPTKTKFVTVMLFKRPYVTPKTLQSLSIDGQLNDNTYIEALRKLGLIDSGSNPANASDVAREVREKFFNMLSSNLKNYLIIGGHETIGKGIVKLRPLDNVK